jgi:hypothetical protein
MARLLDSEFLNSTLVLMNYLVAVVVIFLELVVGDGLTGLLETEGRTTKKVAKMAVVAETVAF